VTHVSEAETIWICSGRREHSHPDPAIITARREHARVHGVPRNRVAAVAVSLNVLDQEAGELVPEADPAVCKMSAIIIIHDTTDYPAGRSTHPRSR
jgi:hypothetical protein